MRALAPSWCWGGATAAIALLVLSCSSVPQAVVEELAPLGSEVEHQNHALLHFRRGDYLQAHLSVAEAIALAPSDELRSLRGLVLLAREQVDQAEVSFSSVEASTPGEPGSQVGLGHVAINHRDYASAAGRIEPVAKACQDERPGGIGGYRALVCEMAWIGMAWIESNQARFEPAVAWYELALAGSPDHVLALLGMGNALAGLERLDEARASFERVLALDPNNPYARAELGLVLYELGDNEGAERSFEAALAQDPSRYTCPHEGLGLVWLRQGRTEEARAAFEKAIEINPDIEYQKYNGLARILIQEGRLDEARELLRKSIDNYPYDPEASELLEGLGP